jgi:hypothetical protein
MKQEKKEKKNKNENKNRKKRNRKKNKKEKIRSYLDQPVPCAGCAAREPAPLQCIEFAFPLTLGWIESIHNACFIGRIWKWHFYFSILIYFPSLKAHFDIALQYENSPNIF